MESVLVLDSSYKSFNIEYVQDHLAVQTYLEDALLHIEWYIEATQLDTITLWKVIMSSLSVLRR